MKEKIKFKDLSIPLKVAIVGGMVYVISLIIIFIDGFLMGLLGY